MNIYVAKAARQLGVFLVLEVRVHGQVLLETFTTLPPRI